MEGAIRVLARVGKISRDLGDFAQSAIFQNRRAVKIADGHEEHRVAFDGHAVHRFARRNHFLHVGLAVFV